MASRRMTDEKFLYTRDNENEHLLAQRRYMDTVSGVILTPITPLFSVRVVVNDTKVEQPKEFDVRHVLSYIDNPNVSSGVSEMKLAIPYTPGDADMTAQLREILALPRVICVDFHGETNRSFE